MNTVIFLIRKYVEFKHEISIDAEGDPFQYSHDLEMRLHELSSLSKFIRVFQCMDGTEKVEHWLPEFVDYHRTLSGKTEECRVSSNNRELRDRLIIAQALGCLDRFCVAVFAGNGFGAWYRQCQVEVTKESREVYKAVLNYIYKGDYANADIALSDIDDRSLSEKDLKQIKHELKSSLNKLMKDTKSIVNWLDGKIEREEDNRNQVTIMKENIDKVQIVLNKEGLLELLDDKTQNDLRSFDNGINEQLSKISSKGLRSIKDFMNADSFSEAEQGMENLSCVQRELAGYYTSNFVADESEVRKKSDSIVSDISKRYDS
ncbi:unnamed protein product, partial [Didymodactylos carnosus]